MLSPVTIQDLLDDSIELEQLGSRIQGERDSGLSQAELTAFTERYDRWFAVAVALLPDDLLVRFRSEREGAWHSPKIRSFLEAPLQPNVLFQTDQTNLPGLSYWTHPFDQRFRAPLLAQRQILLEAEARIQTTTEPTEPALLAQRICRRFRSFTAALQEHPRNRDVIAVTDEYDVQYLVRAVLAIFFEDVRPEERTPSRGGGGAAMDFFLADERMAFETKMMRASLSVKGVADELILDIARYAARPDVDELVALVYDPDKRILNSAGFERDLSGRREGLNVLVVVSQ
jgi:hypothetical protein